MSRTAHAPWAIALILEIDRHAISFAGPVLRASPERRQVIAAYLAASPPTQERMAEVGRFLLDADHGTILSAAYGEDVQGSRGALRRAGETIHEERFYTLLHQLLSHPPHEYIRTCIARLRSLDLTKLLVVRLLPQTICRANVADAIDSTQMANDVATAYQLLTGRGVDAGELAIAIRQVRGERELTKVWRTWILKCRSVTNPLPACDWLQPLSTPAILHKAALHHQNCLRRFTIDILDEQAGQWFAEARHGGDAAVVHLGREDDRWRLQGIFGPRNARPGRALQDRVEQYLVQHGIEVEGRRKRKETDWDALRRLSAAPMFDFDFG